MDNIITYKERFQAAVLIMAAETNQSPTGNFDFDYISRASLQAIDILIEKSGCKLEEGKNQYFYKRF